MLTERFGPSHHLSFITSGARNPHVLALLADVAEHDRWPAVSEARRRRRNWVVAVPTGVVSDPA